MSFSTTEARPWGSFEVLLDAPDCKVKRIVVKAGKRLSLQRHEKRSEVWTCVSGEGIVTKQPPHGAMENYGFAVGDVEKIPVNTIHRVEASPYQDLVFIEVQTGTYFGEDDIERFEDDYGRE